MHFRGSSSRRRCLYGGCWHFFGSIVVLYVLGRDIESILGQRHFVYLFLCGAVGGELGHLFLMPEETALYGASGAVAAIVIAYATILPEIDLIEWRLPILRDSLEAKTRCLRGDVFKSGDADG